jgi:hypothetical protein
MLKAQIEAVEALAPGADHVTAERAAKMIAALAKTAETLGDLRLMDRHWGFWARRGQLAPPGERRIRRRISPSMNGH